MESISEAAFLDLFQAGQRVYVGGSANEPRGLVALLSQHPERAGGITFIQQPLAVNETDFSGLAEGCRQVTFFMTPTLREGLSAGRVDFIPMQMRAIFDYLSNASLDLALLQAARDASGQLRFGPNVDYVDAVLHSARQVVLQINPELIAPAGTRAIDESEPWLTLEKGSPPTLFPEPRVDETSGRIGKLVAGIIRDGDCLQTGIGAVPAAILADLGDRNDLGFHGGLIDDGVVRLVDNGNLTGAQKAIDRGKHVSGMALGSQALLDRVSGDSSFVFRSADYTHEVSVISQLDSFVSVNSAVEIDLSGQINAEVTGGRQISGTGGSVDFMRAAKASRNGRSVVAMSATARGGKVSRIVPSVEVVTALRTDVDMVVTEYGVAHLKELPLQERARRLIDIAHPDFRDELQRALAQ